MNKSDVTVLMRSVATVVREFVDDASLALGQRIDQIEASFKALPTPKDGKDGEPGKSVAVEDVRPLVGELVTAAVAQIPVPKNGEPGKDADPIDTDAVIAAVVALVPKAKDGASVSLDDVRPLVDESVTTAVARAVSTLPAALPGKDAEVDYERIGKAIEEVVAVAVAALPAPLPGKDADEAAIVTKVLAAIPAPKNGDKGDPGKDADPVDTSAIVADVLAQIPKPENGKDADPVDVAAIIATVAAQIPAPLPGKDGLPGRDGTSVDDVEVEAIAQRALDRASTLIAALPLPKDGEPGKNGTDGKSFTVDDVRQMFEAEQAKWALEWERRASDTLQRALDRMPVPKDGIDGLSIEDLDITHDGDGNVSIAFVRGAVRREFVIRLPRVRDKGVFRDTEQYREGDGASSGGSWFIAQKDAPHGKPGETDDWRLAAKRGRDGKDAVPVPRAPEPVRLK